MVFDPYDCLRMLCSTNSTNILILILRLNPVQKSYLYKCYNKKCNTDKPQVHYTQYKDNR